MARNGYKYRAAAILSKTKRCSAIECGCFNSGEGSYKPQRKATVTSTSSFLCLGSVAAVDTKLLLSSRYPFNLLQMHTVPQSSHEKFSRLPKKYPNGCDHSHQIKGGVDSKGAATYSSWLRL